MKPLILAIAAALVLAVPAAAQDADSVRLALSRQGACGGAMQVATGGERIHGRCRLEDERLVVRTAEGERAVPYAAVDSVWVRRRGTGSGATIGAAAGVVLLGGAGLLLARGFCEGGDDCGTALLLVLGAAAAGGTGGALIGGALGSTTRVWIRIFP